MAARLCMVAVAAYSALACLALGLPHLSEHNRLQSLIYHRVEFDKCVLVLVEKHREDIRGQFQGDSPCRSGGEGVFLYRIIGDPYEGLP